MITMLTRFGVSDPAELSPSAQEWFYHNGKPYTDKAGNLQTHPFPKVQPMEKKRRDELPKQEGGHMHFIPPAQRHDLPKPRNDLANHSAFRIIVRPEVSSKIIGLFKEAFDRLDRHRAERLDIR